MPKKIKSVCLFLFLNFFVIAEISLAQQQYPWPVTPFNQSHEITGSFAEYRDTSVNGHFHNGTDIPKPDGSPVYPVKDGLVTDIGTVSSQGSNAYVRIQDVAYVHISPNPSLSIGDSVYASQTVLGTILSGLGHVHFTNGFVGAEKNSLLPNRDLSPYEDPWPPIIRYVRFFQNNSTLEFPGNELSGLVDIMVKVDEQNGPPSSNLSRRNNGTYKIGYKILSADSSTVVFEPSNGGVRFQFDTKPSNSFVNTVFYRPLSSTTSHVYQVTNDVSRDNFWNTAAIPVDNYVVMVFTEDTRGNTDTAYVTVKTTEADLTPPEQPVFKFIKEGENGLELGWFPNTDEDLVGYRLYFAFDDIGSFTIFRDEKVLTAALQDTSINQVLNRDVYFRLTAVDDAPVPNESIPSDIYGASNGTFTDKVLIVDGFDRTDGSWTQPNHYFVFTHGRAIIANGFSFDSAPNEAITNGIVDMNDYHAVFWILGDEAAADETFSAEEQALIQIYLGNGGRLFVSGSDIAWDLDQDSDSSNATAENERFLHEYLKADFASKNSGQLSVTGIGGSIFEGLSFDFGVSPYAVDSSDVILVFGENANAALQYSETQTAAIQYAGPFGNGTISGKLVYVAFPFETIAGETNQREFMARVLDFFFNPTAVEPEPSQTTLLPKQFALLQNYPNPFNPETTIEFHLPVSAKVTLAVYNTLGQKIRTLLDEVTPPGEHKIVWNGLNETRKQVPSGLYVLKMSAERLDSQNEIFQQTHKMLMIK